MRKDLFCFAFIVLFFTASFAEQGNLSNSISLGYIKSGSAEIGAVSWKPDLKLGPWSLGLDTYLPLGNNRPEGFDSIVFRYAEFNDGQKGLRYGVLDNFTLGRGLLMKSYSTRTSGSITQTNRQTALKGYYNFDRIGVQAMSTWSHIFALRLTEKVHPLLTLGQSYITDSDGPRILQPNGNTVQNPSVSGMALDAAVPLPLNLEGYAEAAQLFDHGAGFTAGINWALDALVFSAAFDAGYRIIDKKFVPGYFSADYETNPVNFSSYEANNQTKDGYIAELKAMAGSALKLNAIYESYRGSNSTFYADAYTELDKITASMYFKQPNFQDFRSLTYEEGAISGGVLGYKITSNTTVVVNFKKAYDPLLGRVIESQYYEAKLVF